jgi:hypothetical protein
MARRRSKTNRVTVNPQATEKYVVGVLSGADAYITGLLSGTGLYDNWAQVEGSLEGKELKEYVPNQMKDALSNETNRKLLEKAFNNFSSLTADEKVKLNSILSNYQRVQDVDKYMIEAGDTYRDSYYVNAYKTKNMQLGLNKLETEGMRTGIVKDRVGAVLSKLMYSL